jgi:hypothetical protein
MLAARRTNMRGKKFTRSLWESLKERDDSEDRGVDGKWYQNGT